MIAVIEADAHSPIRAEGRLDERVELLHIARSELFHEHVLACLQSIDGHGRQGIVSRRDNDEVGIRMADHPVDVDGDAPRRRASSAARSGTVSAQAWPRAGKGGGAFPADEATDDGDSTSCSCAAHVMPRSLRRPGGCRRPTIQILATRRPVGPGSPPR
jgi:hypothetical protein